MAKNRDPFFLALGQIRERAQQGRYAPGRPVVIVDEARRLNLSTTPVREAMSWLCGEGILERGPSGGFLAGRLDASVVRHLYDFRRICLIAGLDLTACLPGSNRPVTGCGLAQSLQLAFDTLVRRTGNPILLEAFGRAGARLLRVWDAERRVFGDVEEEAGDLLERIDLGDAEGLRASLRDYHRRRSDAAAILVIEADEGDPEPSSDRD